MIQQLQPLTARRSSNRTDARSLGLAIATTLVFAGVATYKFQQFQSQESGASQVPQVTVPKVTKVAALGRIEPQGEVIKVSAPTSSQENRVEQLLVKEGHSVKAGQIIAVLDSKDRLQAALTKAQEQVRLKQVNLKKVKAGAKRGEIEAQKAQISRLQAQQLKEAQAVLTRINATSLRQISEAQIVLTRINTTGSKQVSEAQATLDKIAEVRPVDVEEAQIEVDDAIAQVNQAQKNLEQAYVRTPQDGQVLEIHTRAGEVVSEDGIVEMGQTSQMYVVAEVYQSDVSKVRQGQRVRITSDSLPEELQGKADLIGFQVRRQSVVNTDPSSNIDARVVEVHIKLDKASSQKAAKFTNLQVKAVIEI